MSIFKIYYCFLIIKLQHSKNMITKKTCTGVSKCTYQITMKLTTTTAFSSSYYWWYDLCKINILIQKRDLRKRCFLFSFFLFLFLFLFLYLIFCTSHFDRFSNNFVAVSLLSAIVKLLNFNIEEQDSFSEKKISLSFTES